MNDKEKAVREFIEILLEAIEDGKHGNYEMCAAIVESFRIHKGEEKANDVRQALWEMIKGAKDA